MSSETVYISIGSNIEPHRYIPKAVALLQSRAEVCDLQLSSFYASEAVGRPDQPEYRNAVASFSTSLEPEVLKTEVLRQIEKECGRTRTSDLYAPRTLDLDIILFGQREIRTDSISIPDSAIWEHVFVTIPLLEIAPHLQIPGRGQTVSDLKLATDPFVIPKDETLNQLLTREGTNHG